MELQRILDELNLTIYGAAQIIAAETDETLIAVQMRWGRWVKRLPDSVSTLERDLEALGYRLEIKRIKDDGHLPKS